jgi:signal transduction histidine kinase
VSEARGAEAHGAEAARGAPLRVLVVEDSDDDTQLLVRILRRGGYDVTFERVESAEAMSGALDRQSWDLIIADHEVPGFGGLPALALVRRREVDIPFFIVSGSITEDVAVAAMKMGAHDFLHKQSLARLVPAVARELGEAEVRRQRLRAQRSLQFLAEAGGILTESLDLEGTLARVVNLAVPTVSDWCVLDLADDAGCFRRLTGAHADPTRAPLLREFVRGYPPEASIPQPSSQALKTGEAVLVADVSDALLESFARDANQLRLLRKLGCTSIMSVPLVARGKLLGALSFASESRRHDAADLTLASELARRAASVIDNARLFRDAQQAIEARDEFLAVASHELRTPLTPLRLQLQLLAELVRAGSPDAAPTSATPALDTPKLSAGLELAQRQITRLEKLVEHLLDISRVSAGAVDFQRQEVDLAVIARRVAARLGGEAARAGSVFDVEASGEVLGWWDGPRLERVLDNLLSNAIKYGAGHPIELCVTADEREATLVVRDHGVGIAPEHHSRIFERFERAVSGRHYGGFGLGLWIARQLVSELGGTISVASSPGDGATFSVSLPRSTAPALSPPPSPVSDAQGSA